MEESAVPPPEPSPNGKSKVTKKVNWHEILWALGVALAVVVVVGGLWLAGRDNNSSSSSGSAHLVIDNHNSSTLYLADANGKQIFKQTYPAFSYVNFEASSPKGQVLLSRGITTPDEDFSIITDGKAKNLSADATKALHQAIVLNNSHHAFFTSETALVFVTCPSGTTCKLMNLNISSGQATQIIDTGAKAQFTNLPPVYPLGVGDGGKTVYLRTITENKLGKSAAAVYAVSDGKVTHNWPLARNADYTPSLSPDANQVAFKVNATKPAINISVLNLGSGKTSTAKWTSGEISDTSASLVWSPDSKKILLVGTDALLPRASTDKTFDINFGYLDVAANKITKLTTIQDSAHHQIAYQAWLNNDTAVYNQDTTSKAYDFSSPTSEIFKLSLSGNPAKLKTPAGKLQQVIFY